VRIYDELPIRAWDYWVDENVSHIFYMPVNGPASTAKDIMANEKFGGNYGISWSPNSQMIAYSCKKVAGTAAARSTNSDVYLYNLDGSGTANITDGMLGYDNYPKFSPDGNWITFCSQIRGGFESDRIRLMLYSVFTKNITEITTNFDNWVTEYLWSGDNKSIYFTAPEKGSYQLFKAQINTKAGKKSENTEFEFKIEQLSQGQNDISGLSLTEDGKTLVFGMQNMLRPTNICSISTAGGDVTQITKLNNEIVDKFAPSSFEEKWIDTRDGQKLHCWVVYPPNFDKNKKYPMITYCQGGPQQMISQAYGYRWNMSLLSSKGYIIVAPNRRGCPGFGQDWIDGITKNWGGNAMNDLLDATDAMKKEPFVDENKLVAIGASAGGYSTFWLAGHHEGRFKAFLSHCGLFDLKSFYGSTEELFFPDWEWGGPFWEDKNKAFYEQNSPSNFVDKWDTPIIISTGEMDFRVPYTQSLQAFTAAQVKGIPSKLLVYPEQNHFVGKSQEYIIWFNEVFAFFEEHLNKVAKAE
jgi:dipeptidyl aminopeptidase/acylaminoacyl peptidase